MTIPKCDDVNDRTLFPQAGPRNGAKPAPWYGPERG